MIDEHSYPTSAQMDQAAAGMRDLTPFLAATYKGLVANGLEPDDAARVVAAIIFHKPDEEE